jgi:hypothetical protein
MGAAESSQFFRYQGFASGGSPQNPNWQVTASGGMASSQPVTFTGNVTMSGTVTTSGTQSFTGTVSIPNLLNSTTALDSTVTTVAASPAVSSSVTGAAASANLVAISVGANTSGAHIFGFKTRDTTNSGAATTTIVTGDVLFSLHACGADGTSYVDSAGIQFLSAGTIASTRIPSQIKFFTGTDAAPTVKTVALTLTQAQQAQFASTVMAANIQNSTTALDATVTAAAPSPNYAAVSAPGTNAQLAIVSTGASATACQFVALKTRATTAGGPATTVVVTADQLMAYRHFGADGTNYVESSKIVASCVGTIASTRVAGQISVFTGTDAAPTVLTEALRIDQAQNVKLGNFTGALLAQGATGGFMHIPACATGKPNGTPVLLVTGLLPMVFDSVGAKISVYSGGAWIQTAALT